jgi:DNA modification methylase
MPGFREYKSLKDEWGELTYNPQKTEGKPYKIKGNKLKNESIYGGKDVPDHGNKTGDRHPTSILQFPNDFEYQNNSNHEMVYVFKDKQGTYNPQKTEGKPYKAFETKHNKQIGEVYCGKSIHNENKGDRHPTSILQFNSLDLVEPNNNSHEMVYVFKDKQGTYNPQKTEGKPYKHSGIRSSNLIYGGGLKCSNQEKTDRHPSTILKFSNPKKSLHRTAKPVDLCEWLIKTYSNEGELVLDFTMGSGSTGIACLNTGRGFIGIEKDPDIFKVARHRLFKNELCQILKNDQ